MPKIHTIWDLEIIRNGYMISGFWMGTSRAYSFTQMIDSFGNEKQHSIHGVFPNVSNTGNWADVGHYTHVVWRKTTRVGCAGVDGPDGNYRLVCRYNPPGNVMNEPVF